MAPIHFRTAAYRDLDRAMRRVETGGGGESEARRKIGLSLGGRGKGRKEKRQLREAIAPTGEIDLE